MGWLYESFSNVTKLNKVSPPPTPPILRVSVKATVTNPKGSVEKLSPKESPEDAHTVLNGAVQKDSISIQGAS